MQKRISVELPRPKEELSFTGERYIPTFASNVEAEHIHRYLFSAALVDNKRVLDIACGEGYGSFILATRAEYVLGVDISESAVSHAQALYHGDNLEYRTGSCLKIPLEDKSVDAVVSFETIEHINEHEEFLLEIQRVLKPGGILCMSTPDKDFLNEDNEFHVRELRRREFETLLGNTFPYYNLYGQNGVFASMLTPVGERTGSSTLFHKSEKNRYDELVEMPIASYLVAVASFEPIAIRAPSILMDETLIPHLSLLFGRYDAKLDEAHKEVKQLRKRISTLEKQLKQSLQS